MAGLRAEIAQNLEQFNYVCDNHLRRDRAVYKLLELDRVELPKQLLHIPRPLSTSHSKSNLVAHTTNWTIRDIFGFEFMAFDKLTDQQALLPMMHKLTKEIRAIITQDFQSHHVNLSKEQAIVLKLLMEQDGRPQHDLALVTSRDKTSLTRLLSGMEKKGLIRRAQSAIDKRVNHVYITKAGLAEMEKAKPIMLSLLNRAIAGIDEKRIDAAKELIKDIYDNLNLEHEK